MPERPIERVGPTILHHAAHQWCATARIGAGVYLPVCPLLRNAPVTHCEAVYSRANPRGWPGGRVVEREIWYTLPVKILLYVGLCSALRVERVSAMLHCMCSVAQWEC